MSLNMIYVTILAKNTDVSEDEADQLIRDTFIKEYQEGGPWGSVIRDAVERNFDLDVQMFTIFTDISDDNQAKMVARHGFENYAPHVNPDDHSNFILRNKIHRDGKDYDVVLYLVLIDEQTVGSKTYQTTTYPESVGSSKPSFTKMSRELSTFEKFRNPKSDFLINLALFISANIYFWFFFNDPSSTEHIILVVLTFVMGLLVIHSGYRMYRKGMSTILMVLITFAVLASLASIVIVRGFI